jgi:putative membrane protein insertion efficiency factor
MFSATDNGTAAANPHAAGLGARGGHLERRTRVRALAGMAAVVAALGVGAASQGQALALGAIHIYQHRLSPLAGRAGFRCRFQPTCSRYAEAVIRRDGLVRGGWRALARIARCGPWTAMGTVDPVPESE